MSSVEKGEINTIEELLRSVTDGIDQDLRLYNKGTSLLHVAAEHSRGEILRMLLKV